MATKTMNRNIVLPGSFYELNPVTAIKSILGNDVKIIEYKKLPVILTHSNVLVHVEYTYLDLDPFKLFKINSTKQLANNQQKYVTNIDGHTILFTNNNNNQPFWTKLRNIKENGYQMNAGEFEYNIYYYGSIIRSQQDIQNSYCSIILNNELGLHGTKIEVYANYKKPFKDLIPNHTFKTDVNYEKNLISTYCAINNYTIAKKIDTTYWMSEIDKNNIPDSIVIDCSDISPNDLVKKLSRQKAVIFCLSQRKNPFVFLLIPHRDGCIKLPQIQILVNTLILDAMNLNVWLEDGNKI
jgi:hypothetical protein